MGFTLRADLLRANSHPQAAEITEKINEIDGRIACAFDEWKQNRPGRFDIVERFRNWRKPAVTHESASTPFDFTTVDKEAVKRKAKLHKTIITAALVGGTILLGIALFAPLAMVPAISAIPITYLVIIGVSLLSGIIGTIGISAAVINKDTQARRWKTANGNKFGSFVSFVESKMKFKLSEEQLKNKQLHRLYRQFDEQVLKTLTQYKDKHE